MKKLPLGLSDFKSIRTEGYKYIDKTQYIHQICTNGKFYFISRPRRFGKSMTTYVFKELFEGNKSIFEGLWIQNHWDFNKIHPVIRISFTGIGFHEIGLRNAIEQELNEIAKNFNIITTTDGIASKFRQIIRELSKQNNVVVLIDEYDAPIIQYLAIDNDKAKENREILKDFYTVLKDNDGLLEFVFITGVSKFSKVGIFSGLNNLVDITMDSRYATMFGYTQQELELYFAENIAQTALKLNISTQQLLQQLKFWYNGYKFHVNAPAVYNPVSVNLFFYYQEFQNFWFQTGTPTFLINLLKKEGIYDFDFEPQGLQTFDTFDLEELNSYGLMYQTGYLTIKEKDDDGLYILDYPNFEVKNSMIAYLLEAFGGISKGSGQGLAIKIEKAFKANDIDKVIDILKTIFSKLPYFLHEKYPESFFHAAIHLLFTYMGIRIHSEVCTADGRVDSLVETDSHFYILEFKLDKSADIALQQIIDKKYYQAYYHQGKTVIAIGVNFASSSKNIDEWKAKIIL